MVIIFYGTMAMEDVAKALNMLNASRFSEAILRTYVEEYFLNSPEDKF